MPFCRYSIFFCWDSKDERNFIISQVWTCYDIECSQVILYSLQVSTVTASFKRSEHRMFTIFPESATFTQNYNWWSVTPTFRQQSPKYQSTPVLYEIHFYTCILDWRIWSLQDQERWSLLHERLGRCITISIWIHNPNWMGNWNVRVQKSYLNIPHWIEQYRKSKP